MQFCPNCGLREEVFVRLGKWGCSTCALVFPPQPHPELTSTTSVLELIQLEVPRERISFRYRIARCFSKGFFPYWDRQELQAERFRAEIAPFSRGNLVSPATEDHLRWEWWENSPWSLEEKRFWCNRKLWAWRPGLGFLNACPTNRGRGDRLSLRFSATPKESRELSRFTALDGGSLLYHPLLDVWEISWKNLKPKRRRQIQKILGVFLPIGKMRI